MCLERYGGSCGILLSFEMLSTDIGLGNYVVVS